MKSEANSRATTPRFDYDMARMFRRLVLPLGVGAVVLGTVLAAPLRARVAPLWPAPLFMAALLSLGAALLLLSAWLAVQEQFDPARSGKAARGLAAHFAIYAAVAALSAVLVKLIFL